MSTTAATLPPALGSVIQELLQERYGPEQREECSGWRDVFEEIVAEDGSSNVLVATRDVEACEVCMCVVR